MTTYYRTFLASEKLKADKNKTWELNPGLPVQVSGTLPTELPVLVKNYGKYITKVSHFKIFF